MIIRFEGLSSDAARELRAGGPDAYGNPPERHGISDGTGAPCRHCLRDVPAGLAFLVLAWRPFAASHAYAETGPVFLCAEDCASGAGRALPETLLTSPDYLVKGYSADERIVYGTGGIVPREAVAARAAALLADPGVAFVDIRSARNNCFLARARRART
jgi:hypothetical protein